MDEFFDEMGLIIHSPLCNDTHVIHRSTKHTSYRQSEKIDAVY